MTLDYTQTRKLKIDMRDYIKELINEFSQPLHKMTKTPWNEKLFKFNKNSPTLN